MPIQIPNSFYYQQTSSATTYGTKQSGNLSVNEFIKQKPYWIQSGASLENKPKTIVLANWSRKYWSIEKCEKMEVHLNELLAKGFSLYSNNKGTKVLVLDSPEAISNYLSPSHKKAELLLQSQEEVSEKFRHMLKISQEEILILDDDEVNNWLGLYGARQERRVILSEIMALNNDEPEMLNKVMAFLSSKPPGLNTLVHDEFSKKANSFFMSLMTNHSFAHSEVAFKTLSLSGAEVSQLQEDEFLPLDSRFFNSDDLSNITNLQSTFSVGDSVNDKWLLDSCLNLRTLDIPEERLSKYLQCDDLAHGSLQALESIRISSLILNVNAIATFLKRAPKLSEIDLSCNDLDFSDLEKGVDDVFGQIRTLTFPEVSPSLTFDRSVTLLSAMPYIERLTLGAMAFSLFDDNGRCLFDEVPLGSLKELGATSLSVTYHQFGFFLNTLSVNSPLIERLDLSDLTLKDGPQVKIESVAFDKLHALTMDVTDINAEFFSGILRTMPMLNELELTFSTLTNGRLDLAPGALSHLTAIDLNRTTISEENLAILLKAAPNLKSFKGIAMMIEPSSFEINTSFMLPYVESIDLTNTSLSRSLLANVFSAPESLETLALTTRSHVLSERFCEKAKKVETLILSDNSITLTSLSLLLKNKGIKTLELIGCRNLGDTRLSLEGEVLESLETLCVQMSTLTTSSIAEIIKAAPNLVEVKLNYLSDITDLTFDDDVTFKKLKNVTLKTRDLDFNVLNKLLIAMPELESLDITCVSTNHGMPLTLEGDSLKKLRTVSFSSFNDSGAIFFHQVNSLLLAAPNMDNNSRKKLRRLTHQNTLNRGFDRTLISDRDLVGVNHDAETDKIHDSSDAQNFKPTPKDKKFRYERKYDNVSQGMLIEQFSQYLTLRKMDLHLIPTVQDGMCNALSFLFNAVDESKWQEGVDSVYAWQGDSIDSCDDTAREFFEEISTYVKNYQVGLTQANIQYLGDGLFDYIKKNESTSFIISNANHAVCVKKKGDDYLVYDPNFVKGYKTCSEDSLSETLMKSIGSLCSVTLGQGIALEPVIESTHEFIQKGGLSILLQASNADNIYDKLDLNADFSTLELNGILLRNLQGKPAWQEAMSSYDPKLKRYTMKLLMQFIEKNPSDFILKLNKSIELLEGFEKLALLEALSNLSGTDERILALKDSIRAPDRYARYEQTLATWEKKTETIDSIPSYVCHVLSHRDIHSKQLIELDSRMGVNSLMHQIKQQAAKTEGAVFVINHPDDLICSAPFIKKQEDGSGMLTKGPGGALHDFLLAHNDSSPTLLINYDKFSSEDIIKFNALLDDTAKADGTALPDNTKIIGFINTDKPNGYQGSDFYSRFSRVETCPLSNVVLRQSQQRMVFHDETLAQRPENVTVINLFHACDWREKLMGHWVLDGDHLQFEEGELTKALATGNPIQINQGFWEEDLFHDFIRDNVPFSTWFITPKDDYDWQALSGCLHVSDSFDDPVIHTLNPSALSNFFGRYVCDDLSKRLKKQKGIIETHEQLGNSHALSVRLTRAISDDEWATFLYQCQEAGIGVDLNSYEGVAIPEPLQPYIKNLPSAQVVPWNGEADLKENDFIISSNDVDVSMSGLPAVALAIIIDVSELSGADLLGGLNGHFNKESLALEFSSLSSALLDALEQSKTVVLKGEFSEELSDALAPIFLQRQQSHEPKGRLILICDKAEATFPYASKGYQHVVTKEEKQALLKASDAEIELLGDLLATESFVQLKARLSEAERLQISVNKVSPWQGLKTVDAIDYDTQPLDFLNAYDESIAFMTQRRDSLNLVLAKEPYVFISGVSGVGKSTFVRNDFCGDNDELFEGEQSLKAWAQSMKAGEVIASSKRKILFIDEANLSHKQWSELEGLFDTPKTLLIEGVLYPISDNHKVIFAGNPLNYGDERHMAPLFERHGNAVLFAPLSKAVLFEKVLKPILGDNEGFKASLNHILTVYQSICSLSSTEILMSPRELQMMALLIKSHIENNPNALIESITKTICYAVARPCVPDDGIHAFDDAFKPVFSPESETYTKIDGFVITPSRQAIATQLTELLKLRAFRQQDGNKAIKAIASGGLGGIILEGEPGIGKSVQVIKQLRNMGYEEEKNLAKATAFAKPYYLMPVSMPYDEKEKLLLKAFDEGAVVVIDEINASPMMERLLNDLLMGHRPKSHHEETAPLHSKPGFMVIGTQNPITMSGRRAPSTALKRRMMTSVLAEYTADEMTYILKDKGVPLHEAEKMVEIYQKQRRYASANHLSPAPNFRQLERMADAFLKSGIETMCLQQIGIPLAMEAAFIEEDEKPFNKKIDLYDGDLLNDVSKPIFTQDLFVTSFDKIENEKSDLNILDKGDKWCDFDKFITKDIGSMIEQNRVSTAPVSALKQSEYKALIKRLQPPLVLSNVGFKASDGVLSQAQVEQLTSVMGVSFEMPSTVLASTKEGAFNFDFKGHSLSVSVAPGGRIQCFGLDDFVVDMSGAEILADKLVAAYLISSGGLYNETSQSFDVDTLPSEVVIETENDAFRDHLRHALQTYGIDSPSQGMGKV